MGRLMRAADWSASPLGHPQTWPQSLRSVVGLLLSSKFPMFVAWGPELGFLYNDPYADILGAKHPRALGARFYDIWSEIWPDIWPLIEAAMSGQATYRENLPLLMNRKGFDEQTWFTFSYSPVRDETGQVAGMFCACTETTEIVLAARRGAEERSRLARLFEQAPGFMALLQGPEHRFEFTNPAYQRLIGHRNLIGKTLAEALPEAAAQGYLDLLDRVYRTGKAFTSAGAKYEMLPSPGGPRSEHYLDFVYQPVTDAQGRVTGIFVEGYDVTERVMAQSALWSTETRYRALFEAVEVGFCIIEVIFDAAERPTDYLFVEVNPAFERHTGIRDAIGRRMRDIAPTHDDHWFEIYGRIAVTGEPARFENGSGALGRWWDVHAFRVGEPEQRRVAVLFNDITERRNAEMALRELNETLEARVEAALAERKVLADIVENTDAFVQVVDLDYRWLAVNRAAATEFEKIFGVRPKVGDSMLDVLAHVPEHREAVRAAWAPALDGRPYTAVREFGDPGRVRRSYEMRFNVLRDAAGACIGAYQFVYDVTQRLQEQARLRDAEDALRQAQKMETIGQLTGGVAHDFNNLLTPIMGALDVARRRMPGDERLQRATTGALQAAERARVLIQRLLAFARRQHLEPQPVDVRALIEGMSDLVARSLGPDIELKLDFAGSPPPAQVDPNQLELAVLNLAVNARDAMPGGGMLAISAAIDATPAGSSLPPGRYVRIAVADTGTGMDAETMRRAIEPFFTTKGIGRGTGLGLSSVQGLAAQSGGEFRLDSVPGKGTIATLWLPVADGALDGLPSAPAPDQELRPLRSAHILLVDDEELVRMGTADMLVDSGYEVTEAASAVKALEIVRGGARLDAVVTDFAMPGMSGIDLAAELRRLRPDLPVLLITGYAALSEAESANLPRIAKPFRQSDLAFAVGELLDAVGN